MRVWRSRRRFFSRTGRRARFVLGESDEITLRMQWNYAEALFKCDGATPSDLREAVNTLEETVPTTRRLLGGAHPLVQIMEEDLRKARTALRAHGGDVESVREAVAAMTPGDA